MTLALFFLSFSPSWASPAAQSAACAAARPARLRPPSEQNKEQQQAAAAAATRQEHRQTTTETASAAAARLARQPLSLLSAPPIAAFFRGEVRSECSSRHLLCDKVGTKPSGRGEVLTEHLIESKNNDIKPHQSSVFFFFDLFLLFPSSLSFVRRPRRHVPGRSHPSAAARTRRGARAVSRAGHGGHQAVSREGERDFIFFYFCFDPCSSKISAPLSHSSKFFSSISSLTKTPINATQAQRRRSRRPHRGGMGPRRAPGQRKPRRRHRDEREPQRMSEGGSTRSCRCRTTR